MAEEKQFEPTQGRLDRARREGDRPRSGELVAASAFACAAAAVALVLPVLAGAARDALLAATRGEGAPGAYALLACGAAAPMAAAGAGAAIATVAQSGGLAMRGVRLSFEKLNPVAGMRRLFSREALLSTAKACVATLILGAAVIPTVREGFAPAGTPCACIALVARALASLASVGAFLGLALGVLDALHERHKWRHRLRMSFDEFKREMKQSDGDPLFRSRRRQQHRKLVRGSIARLREAAFVVTNPQHIAIALEYHPPEVEVPRVLIRAVDEGAQMVKRRARELGVPLFENVPLARLLLTACEVGAYAPRESYLLLAQIVAELMRSGALA